MIIFSGKGIIILLVFGAYAYVLKEIEDAYFIAITYHQMQWFNALLMLLSGLTIQFLNRNILKPKLIEIVNENGQITQQVEKKDSLFFIRAAYWPYIFFVGGIIYFIIGCIS